MHVLFLYLVPPTRFIPRGFSHGIGSLSAMLKQHGHTADLLYVDALRPKALARKVSAAPGLIAVSATTDQFDLAREVIGFLSSRCAIPIVLGGVHATVAPEEAVSTPGVLGICRGEGEEALLELVTALERHEDFHEVRNFWFRHDGTIVKNDVRPLITDLNALPFPDRTVFDYQAVLNGNYDDGAEFMVGRGCPFQCAFCINPALQSLYRGKGRFVRYRSVEHVIAEITQVVGTYYGIRKLTFQDDILGLDRAWLASFADEYARAVRIPFRCNLRADHIDDETLGLLKHAGCAEIWVGVECGNDDLRNRVLQKHVSTEQIFAAFDLMRKHGIRSKAYNMIGLPGETPAQVEETLRLNARVRPDIKNVTIFRPYPGTALHDQCRERGWISGRKVAGYWEESILDQPTLSKEDTYFYQVLFHYATRLPRVVKWIAWLNRIKITRRLTLFRVLHPKFVLYRLYAILRKLRRA